MVGGGSRHFNNLKFFSIKVLGIIFFAEMRQKI
mgnify:CR=1 FL=1